MTDKVELVVILGANSIIIPMPSERAIGLIEEFHKLRSDSSWNETTVTRCMNWFGPDQNRPIAAYLFSAVTAMYIREATPSVYERQASAMEKLAKAATEGENWKHDD